MMAKDTISAPVAVGMPLRVKHLLTLGDPLLLLPYLYVVVLGLAIYILQSRLLVGPRAVDVRATAVVPLALAAFGQSFALFTRGVDLSIGGIISLTTAILATRGDLSSGTLVLEIVGLVIMGALLGALNGFVVARTHLQPFIVTLATWSIWDGVAFAILPVEGGTTPSQLTSILLGNFVWIIPKSLVALALLFVAWLWIRNTRFIIDLKAIGSDEGRARLTGVPVMRRKIETYAASGMLAALVGIWVAAQTASGAPTAGDEFILNSIAAVVIGGTSIFGGRGSIASSIMGAIAFLMIPDLIYALSLTSFWSTFFQGFLLIVAVTITSLVLQVGTEKGR
jgi:ribose transport system permease protein